MKLLTIIKNKFNAYQDDPILGIWHLITLVFSIIGIAESIEWIINTEYEIYIASALIIVFATLIILFFLRPRAMKYFEVTRKKKNIVLEQENKMIIFKNGTSKYSLSQKMIFEKDPEPDDFTIKMQSSEGESFESMNLELNGTVTNVEKQKNGIIKVTFKPDEDVKKYQVWDFKYSYTPNYKFDKDNYCDSIRVPIAYKIGFQKCVLYTEIPIEKVICFKEPTNIPSNNWEELNYYGLKTKSYNSPSPYNVSENGFEWEIDNPKIGDVYNCTFFYDKGEKKFLKKKKRKIKRVRLFRNLKYSSIILAIMTVVYLVLRYLLIK
ncbi:hypothetical protein SAMN04488029_0588 [Reichenbachiella faecimaris]|uniref:Uncharacterized protein n=1 Tax=Reichenbachiella faecimaris TaxID=692418 RepID=A0A1W2G6F7_REIFA|nr:hypothetical protein [Reichenbachiella faecimaris]SMD32245.1 hypothetical protein SAMN04488029_0588 [Reichenbachiella faecimaris]